LAVLDNNNKEKKLTLSGYVLGLWVEDLGREVGPEFGKVQAKLGLHAGEGAQRQSVTADMVRVVRSGVDRLRCGRVRARWPSSAKVHIEESLQNFIGEQSEAKLWRTTEDSSGAALPEGGEAFLAEDFPCRICKEKHCI